MTKLYWRPQGIPRAVLVLIAMVSLVGLLAVEFLQTKRQQPYYNIKLRAAQVALEGMQIIQMERMAREETIDIEVDPAQSGLIGMPMSSVTTVTGWVAAKQTSVNPNFAAVIVEMLKGAGVKKGDTIAVGASGSFPALNICVYAAARVLEVRPIIISSLSASQFGANDPEFLWVDMERVLHESNPDLFPFRTIAASVGGVDDRGLGMSKQGRQALNDAVARNNLTLIKPESFKDSIDKRMAIFAQQAGSADIKAYINIGGGTISVGTAVGKRMLQPGLNLRKPIGKGYTDAVMMRFIERGIPVIHLTKIEELATRYGLPLQPTTISAPGEGNVFYRNEYNLYLTWITLLIVLASLYAFVRSELGYRILQTQARDKGDLRHEPMV